MGIIEAIIAAVFALVGLAVGIPWGRMRGKAQGKREANAERMQKDAERLDAGRKAVARGRDSGDSPDQRVRTNDGAWD